MITRDSVISKKTKLERLTLIKERYHKLIIRQRQEIEKELQDDFKDSDEFEADTPESGPFEVEVE
jgi:hypothetical protein